MERRVVRGTDEKQPTSKSDVSKASPKSSSQSPHLFLFVFFALTAAAGCAFYWSQKLSASENPVTEKVEPAAQKQSLFKPDHIFTKEELLQYDGSDEGKPLLLAILGKVFDVSQGRKHYGKGAGYNGFAGRDATRAFITGQFDDEGLIDDLTNITDLSGVIGWAEFYETDYVYVGKLVGRYYTADGEPTAALDEVYKGAEEQKRKEAEREKELKRLAELYPHCNSESGTNIRSRVWCTSTRSVKCVVQLHTCTVPMYCNRVL